MRQDSLSGTQLPVEENRPVNDEPSEALSICGARVAQKVRGRSIGILCGGGDHCGGQKVGVTLGVNRSHSLGNCLKLPKVFATRL